ncbi:hypothetical protein GGQ99_001261 [Aminobacter niigataensis]|uniref:DUF982 domain-containing protein n=1 Tax=Aminobacter niigataensis TaxID=83265 RepID=A0ABR6KYE0_9HYPH|nr:DUF982 domain-containing protein [Aminobacter niigataensis]MBB4649539.1 hypothetical protein [Aminobacter niigataensis]
MMWFWPAVSIREIASGHTYNVKTVEVAVEQMETWPLPENGKRGPKWRKAYKVCFDALEGMAEANTAGKAFEAAAKEAGVLRNNSP